MSNPVKYTFDQAFDGGAKSRFDQEVERLQGEAEQARKDSYTQGFDEGKAQALSEIEAATKEIVGQLAQAAHGLFDQRLQLESELKQEMVHLAYAIASKLSSALIRTHPTAEIQALIEDCLATVSQEPRLVVRVSESISDHIAGHIDVMKHATSFAGDIVLIGEPTMGPLDCRVEWPDGGSERNHDALKRQIEEAVQRFAISEAEDTMAEESADSSIDDQETVA